MSQTLTFSLSTVRLPGVVVMLIHSRLIAGTKRRRPMKIELALAPSSPGRRFTPTGHPRAAQGFQSTP